MKTYYFRRDNLIARVEKTCFVARLFRGDFSELKVNIIKNNKIPVKTKLPYVRFMFMIEKDVYTKLFN